MIWNARKAVQWRLHSLSDSVMPYMMCYPLNSRRRKLAYHVAKGLDSLAAHVGGHTW